MLPLTAAVIDAAFLFCAERFLLLAAKTLVATYSSCLLVLMMVVTSGYRNVCFGRNFYHEHNWFLNLIIMAENTGILSINMTRQARNQGVVNRAIAHLKIFTCLVIRYNKFQQFCPPKIVQVTNILPSPKISAGCDPWLDH